MIYDSLTTPGDEKARKLIIEEGGFYSNVLQTWCVSKNLTTYPKAQRKNIRPYLLKNKEIEVKDTEEYVTVLGESLARDFNIDKKVNGAHVSGKTVTLDWVLKPKSTSGWKNPNVALGIDFMLNSEMPTIGTYTEWAKQRIVNACTKWDGYGCLPMFLGPNCKLAFRGADLNIQDLLYAYMIGYCCIDKGFRLFRSKKTVWCQRYGVQDGGKNSPLSLSFGAR